MNIKKILFTASAILATGVATAATVSRVDVVGNQRMDAESIRILADVKVGDNVSAEGANQIAKRLQESGYFSRVSVRMSGNVLKIDITEAPTVNMVTIEGNDEISTDDLKKELRLKSRDSYDESVIGADVQRILTLYQRKGFFGTTVEPQKIELADNRVNVVYARVSTPKQKRDLENQAETLINYCNANGVKVDKVYKDIASGMNFDRKQFRLMLEDVLNYRISSIYITYKDRFSRISFDMFERLFLEYNCKIIVINKTESTAEEDEKEIFSDIISMLHCFAMKMYSRRRKKKMELIKEDLKNELDL